ncbi:MAG: SAM hydrolase/SAM-dependent halogenase family protein, partial [Actinomycetota bacterium]
VSEGALVLAQSLPYMPEGVHLAVVDPGVGSGRRHLIVVAGDGSCLVGPDNGLLVPAACRLGGIVTCHKIENRELMAARPSRTFHGRDVFAPAAAHLALGVAPQEFGDEVAAADLVSLTTSAPRLHEDHLHAIVTHVDRFGNLQMNVSANELANIGLGPGSTLEVRVEGRWALVAYRETYASVAQGDPVLTEDSYGLLSLAVNQGSAADRFRGSLGAKVILGPPGSSARD